MRTLKSLSIMSRTRPLVSLPANIPSRKSEEEERLAHSDARGPGDLLAVCQVQLLD